MLQYAEVGTLGILVIYSIVMLAVVLERFVAMKRTDRQEDLFEKSLAPVLESGDEESLKSTCGESPAPLARVLADIYALKNVLHPEQTQMMLSEALEEASSALRRFLAILATLASTAPFVGLFGTVLGIMHTFSGIAAEGFGNTGVLSAGISQALIATAAGLGVAIPSVIFYNYFTRRSNRTIKTVKVKAKRILILHGRI